MSQIKRYTGSAWEEKPVKRWNGTAWEDAPLKYWSAATGSWRPVEKIVPAGIIIGLNDSIIPSNWSRFTDADDKFIVGAGSTFAAGDSSAATVHGTINVASVANHTGTSAAMPPANNSVGTWAVYSAPGSSAGGHSHTLVVNYQPDYQDVILIQADSDLTELPQHGVVFNKSNTGPAGLTGVFTGNRFLRGDNAVATGSVATAVTNTAASHQHTVGSGATGGGVASYYTEAAGGHSHTCTISAISHTLRRAYLRAWSDASAAFPLAAGMIAMWDTNYGAIPADWRICDGENGTPDLRDYFIVLSSDADTASVDGSNQMTISATVPSASHDHQSTQNISIASTVNAYHPGSVSHTHTSLSNVTVDYLPPYIALIFIMRD